MRNDKQTEETTTGEESATFFGEDAQLIQGTGDIELPPPVSDPVPLEEVPVGEPIESPVEIVDPQPEELSAEVPEEPNEPARIARAIQIHGDVVDNVLMVAVDENDNAVGYPLPYGYELIVVEDDSPIGTGWIRIDGEFVSPEAE